MTVIVETADYLVENDSGMLTISRYTDGACKACIAVNNVGAFRSDLKSYGVERTIRTWLNGHLYKIDWMPMYKPERMPRAI